MQNVAVTGGFIAISNVPTVTLSSAGAFPVTGAGGFFGITGSPTVNVVNSGSVLNISGIVTAPYLTGIFSPVFTGITGSQIQIPAGVKSYSVFVLSGSAFVQGTLLPTTSLVKGGRYGGGFLSSYALNVGCTGGFTVITWET